MKYYRSEVPAGVLNLVTAVIAERGRRSLDIRLGTREEAVLEEYRRVNAEIDRALENLEPALRPCMIADIVRRRGYRYSDARELLSKDAYYKRKNRLIADIARRLLFF